MEKKYLESKCLIKYAKRVLSLTFIHPPAGLSCNGQQVALAVKPAELFEVVINKHFNVCCN